MGRRQQPHQAAGRRAPAEYNRPSRHRAHRRLRLAPRRQLAEGDARPGGARAGHPRLSRSGECLRRGGDGRRRGAAPGRSSRRCAGASRRTTSRCRRRTAPFAYAMRYEHGAEHPMVVRTPRDGGDEKILLDANAHGRRARPISASAASPTAPTTACSPIVGRERQRVFHAPHPRLARPASISPTSSRRPPAARSGPSDGKTLFYVWVDANHRPGEGLPPRRRHRSEGRCRRLRGQRPRLLHRRRQDPVAALHPHRQPRPRDVGGPLHRRRPRRRARRASSRARQTAQEYSVDHGGDRFYILTNAGGAEDFKIVTAPVATPGPPPLARPRPARARAADPRCHRLRGLPRPARARGEPAAHRHPPSRDRRGARHRLRRGGLFARHDRRLRVRHDDAPLQLFVDGDAGARLRLRHGDARRAALRKEEEIPSGHNPGRLRHAPRLRAGRRRRDRAGLAPLPQGHAARRHRAVPALRLRRLRHRDPGGLRHHAPVAGRSRLRLRHRPCPRRQGQGLPLVRRRPPREEGQHLHRFHRRRRSSSIAEKIHRRAAASSAGAARPAAC